MYWYRYYTNDLLHLRPIQPDLRAEAPMVVLCVRFTLMAYHIEFSHRKQRTCSTRYVGEQKKRQVACCLHAIHNWTLYRDGLSEPVLQNFWVNYPIETSVPTDLILIGLSRLFFKYLADWPHSVIWTKSRLMLDATMSLDCFQKLRRVSTPFELKKKKKIESIVAGIVNFWSQHQQRNPTLFNWIWLVLGDSSSPSCVPD